MTLYPTSVTSKFQVTLPVGIRDRIGVTQPGKYLIGASKTKLGWLLKIAKPSKSKSQFLQLEGSLHNSYLKLSLQARKKIAKTDFRQFMEENYERI